MTTHAWLSVSVWELTQFTWRSGYVAVTAYYLARTLGWWVCIYDYAMNLYKYFSRSMCIWCSIDNRAEDCHRGNGIARNQVSLW